MKVIQATTWSFEPSDKFIRKGGEYSSEARYGYEFLRVKIGEGYKVVCPNKNFLERILVKLFRYEGDVIYLQIMCAIKANKVDLLYYPTDRHAWLLAILRKIRICKKPILMVSHFSFNTTCVDSKFKKYFLRFERHLIFHSIDRVVFASEKLLELAKEDYKIPKKHQSYVGWGADLSFYGKVSFSSIYNFPYFFAAGGANRDYTTLINAFRKSKYNLVISCSPQTLNVELPKNIHIFDYSIQGIDATAKLRNLYQNCKAVLIPINKGNHVPNGASVLVESIACGKPVIISDLKSNFVDVEKEGIGYTVKMHDADDWVKQVTRMATTKDYNSLVDNCHRLAQQYNYETFAKEIYGIMLDMVEK